MDRAAAGCGSSRDGVGEEGDQGSEERWLRVDLGSTGSSKGWGGREEGGGEREGGGGESRRGGGMNKMVERDDAYLRLKKRTMLMDRKG
jgi:hypothetical protein